MQFEDPLGLSTFALPIGWGLDPFESDLTTVMFRHWDPNAGVLSLTARPSLTAPSESADGWRRAWRGELTDLNNPRAVECRSGDGLEGDMPVEDRQWRVLAVRGTRVDVLAQHRSLPADPSLDREDPLRGICVSLVVGADLRPPTQVNPEEIFDVVNSAQTAREEGRLADAAGAATEALEAARSCHLAAWLGEARVIVAVVRAMARALLIRGAAVRDVTDLSLADEVLTRLMGSVGPGPAIIGLDDDLRLARQFQLELAPVPEWADPDRGRVDTRISRGVALLGIAKASAGTDVGSAVRAATLSVGALAPVAPSATEAERPALLSRLLVALQAVAELTLVTGELGAGVAAGREMLAVARELARSGPPERDADAKGLLAMAVLTYAQQLARINDTHSLTYAAQLLGQVEREAQLNEPQITAWADLLWSRVLHQQRAPERALARVEKAEETLGTVVEPDALLEQLLRSQKARLLAEVGAPDETRQLISEILAEPLGLGPNAAMQRADVLLTSAEASAAIGDTEGVQRNAVEALRLALPVNWASSTVHDSLDRAITDDLPEDLRIDLSMARLAVVESQEVSAVHAADAVGVRDASVRRQAYERLFVEFLEAGLVLPALLTADRARARLLRDPGRPIPPSRDLVRASLPDAPVDALRTAAAWLIEAGNARLAALGAPTPLELDEVPDLLAALDGDLLVLQPVSDRLALVLLRGTNRPPVVRYSPRTLHDIIEALEQAQGALGVGTGSLGTSIPKLDVRLAVLHAALVAPIANLLEPGRTLYVSPYRELLFVPFALLAAAPGAPMLIEDHAVALLPSLVWLRDVRARPSWSAGEPLAGYVLGDPELSDRDSLPPLPGARQEAADVASIWRAAGAPASTKPDLGPEATEDAFRRGLPGRRLVHLACHGQVVDPATASRLYLSPSPPKSDGYFGAYELAALNLDDPMVFMSACESGLGRATTDGILGLSNAFLASGARAVIASLWRVSDAATRSLVGHFYRALLSRAQSIDAAQALRTAMLATRAELAAGSIQQEDGRQPDPGPRSWGAFFLVGDAGAVRIE